MEWILLLKECPIEVAFETAIIYLFINFGNNRFKIKIFCNCNSDLYTQRKSCKAKKLIKSCLSYYRWCCSSLQCSCQSAMFPLHKLFLTSNHNFWPHLPLHSPIALLVEHPSDRPLRRTRTSVLQASPIFGAKTGSTQHARKLWQTTTTAKKEQQLKIK